MNILGSIWEYRDLLWKAILETLQMVVISLTISTILGLFLAILLVVTRPNQIYENKLLYNSLNVIINIFRSIPFIILVFAIIPITKALVGSIIGVKGAIVPLVFYTAPYIARLLESALLEVDKGLIEAFQAMGATKQQIIYKVLLKEARPGIVLGLTTATISLIGATAMAGVMGAGGLGDVAIRYGWQRWMPEVMYPAIIILVLLVQLVQSTGNLVAKKLRKK